MPFDSSGTFNRVTPGGWVADAAAGIKIRADRHDAEDNGFATGLSTCITKDGRTQPTANIPLNNKKIIALGEPTNASDAATKNYVDNLKNFTTGLSITGAGPINGFLHFSSPTGVNGIGWVTADMSWIGRDAVANQFQKLLAVNNKEDGTGTDVCSIGETGIISNTGYLVNNLLYDGTNWRTPGAGTGTMFTYSAGTFGFWANDTVTTVAYQTAAMRRFAALLDSASGTFLYMDKKASGEYCRIQSYMNNSARWIVDLGDSAAESSTRTGSNFGIYNFDNTGANVLPSLLIDRASNASYFGGALSVQSLVTAVTGVFTAGSGYDLVLGGGSATSGIYFRPQGYSSVSGQAVMNSLGSLTLADTGVMVPGKGIVDRQGMSAAVVSSNVHNFFFSSPYFYAYLNDTNLGAVMWQSDYRMKKDIQPLPSMWDKVKALSPIQYSIQDWGIFTNDDTPRWGFVAHELQEKLTKSAANGEKDVENEVQSPNPWTVIAALTKALQEAMSRIEVLEARA